MTYQLLSGRLPYEATSLSELTLKQQREAPIPLEELNPHVPPELARAVAMALAIDQESRPPDAMVFAEALRNGAHGIAPLAARCHRQPRHRLRHASAAQPRAGDGRDPHGPAGAQPASGPGPARPPRPSSASRVLSGRGRPSPPARTRSRNRRRGLRRFVALVAIALLLTAAVAVALILATSTSSTVVHVRTIIGNDVSSAVKQRPEPDQSEHEVTAPGAAPARSAAATSRQLALVDRRAAGRPSARR